jgi:phytoene synthase
MSVLASSMKEPVEAAAGDSIRRHSRSFSFASRLLPIEKRGDVERLYAWCRWCDDGVDTATSPADAAAFVERATADVHLIADGHDPVANESRWLATLVHKHDLSLAAAAALLEGMQSDLTPAADFSEDDLLRYCFQVAGAVGVLMCPVLGLRDRKFLSHAAALGIGMQLTNIARDVAEDWRRDRCYLPLAWTSGLRPNGDAPDPERVRQGVQTLLKVADDYYAAGELGIDALDADARLAVRAAARIYHAIGKKIRKRGFKVLDQRVCVSAVEKIKLFGGALLPAFLWPSQAAMNGTPQSALITSEKLLHQHGVTP